MKLNNRHLTARLVFLLVFATVLNYAQPLPVKQVFEKLTIENGLSSSAIYKIFQDSKGFLWLGTESGLNRYDGYSFKIFKQDQENSNSISDDFVWDICEDEKNNLWFATNNGLNKYTPVNGKFEHFFTNQSNNTLISSNSISSLAMDADNNLWIGTWDAGINIYDFKQSKFLRLSIKEASFSALIVWDIFKDSQNNMWIATEDAGLLVYNKLTKKFTQHLPGKLITTIDEDDKGNIWIGTYGNGLFRYDLQEEKFINYKSIETNQNSIGDNYIWKVYCDSKNVVWISGVSNGLTSFIINEQKFVRYKNNPFDIESLSSNLLLDIFEDRSQNLWIGTVDKGVNKLDRKPVKFYHLKNEPTNPNSLAGNFIFSICEDRENNIWISNFNEGISKYNRKQNRFYFYRSEGSNPNSLTNDQVRTIYEDSSGDLWIGNVAGGFHKYDRQNSTFIRYNTKDGLSNENVRCFFEDRRNNLWIGTSGGGLNKFDKHSRRFTHYKNDPSNKNSLSNNTVTSICQDKNESLWIATYDGGLNKLDLETNKFKTYQYSKSDSTSISSNIILYVYYSRNNELWVGTLNAGINKYDDANDRFIRYNTKNGLIDNYICGIGEDATGNLWISTAKGLSYFNLDKNEFTSYTLNDGLQKGELNPSAFFIGDNGWIYVGGSEGVSAFDPSELTIKSKQYPVVITSIKKFDKEYIDTIETPYLKVLELNHNEHMISFEFAYLDYTSPTHNQFEYKLEGFDKNWINAGTRNFATYTNLDPGKYNFKVRVKSSNENSKSNFASLQIIINPPWWQSYWAYSGYIIIIAAGLLGIRNFEKNRIKLRNELKMYEFESQKTREVESMKSRFFANLSHEFRTPLMLIKGPVEKLLNEIPGEKITNQLKMIERNSNNLQNLIDQLLELSQLEAASIPLRAKEENIIPLLKGLTLTFESLTKEKNIDLEFVSEIQSLVLWIDKDKLEKIINNLLSNAFKFTNDGGKITVTIEQNIIEKSAFVIIEDSGIGIPENKMAKIFDRFYQAEKSSVSGSGIGLALVKELVELHKWKIKATSKVDVGTKFILEIPAFDYLSNKEKCIDDEANSIEKNKSLVCQNSNPASYNEKETKTATDKPTVLLVEDSKDVRIYLSDLLNQNYNVLEASNGKEGIKTASENSPDLIISDIMMPEMDGIEFCKKIKSEFSTSHIPIILLTAKNSQQSKYEGLETGADDYLTKPFDSKELFIRINNLLEQRKRLKEKFSKDINLNPAQVTKNAVDVEFLDKAFKLLENYLGNEEVDSEFLAKGVYMSLSQLRRKLKAVTDQTPGEFIRTYKLKRAAQMLLEKKLNVTQIAFEVGFGSPSHFTKAFKEHFNCLPTEFKG